MELYSCNTETLYEQIAPINEEHGIYLIRDRRTGGKYVKKILKTYNYDVYIKLQSLNIDGIPRIIHMNEGEGDLTVIEECIPGETIDSLLQYSGAMTEDAIINITARLCEILTRLHDQDPPIIHRDIKPSNVMITPEGKVYLLDLNAAKLEDADKDEDTVLLGTYGYAAPEQYGFGSSTVQTDIYAVGMLINTMLNGHYTKETVKGSPLTPVIEKCLMMKPVDRYQTALELREALLRPEKGNIVRFVPPGFRSLNPMHMFTAIIGYAAIASISLTLETRNQRSPAITWYERIFCLCILLSVVLFTADYLGIQEKLPLCRNRNIFIKTMGIVLFAFIIALVLLFIMIVGEATLFHA